jgi:threonine/homoserine/homoserine lactone efflux protein
MTDASSLAAFLGASVVLAVTPGPGVLYVVTRTLAQGRRAGLASAAGVALGNFGNALGASLGLAAVFALSSFAFTAVRLAGALYLVYLGVQALRGLGSAGGTHAGAALQTRRLFRDGFVVALLNPKTALFFAAFLPQFIDPSSGALLQSVGLGALFVAIAAATDSGYVLAAGRLAPALSRSHAALRCGRYGTGFGFIGLGLYTALSGARVKAAP